MRPVCTVRKNLCIMRPSCLHCEQEPVWVSDLSALWKRTCALSDLFALWNRTCALSDLSALWNRTCASSDLFALWNRTCALLTWQFALWMRTCSAETCLLCKWCRDEEGQLQKEMGWFDGRHACSMFSLLSPASGFLALTLCGPWILSL